MLLGSLVLSIYNIIDPANRLLRWSLIYFASASLAIGVFLQVR